MGDHSHVIMFEIMFDRMCDDHPPFKQWACVLIGAQGHRHQAIAVQIGGHYDLLRAWLPPNRVILVDIQQM